MMTWWFLTFMAPAIKSKVHQLPGVEHLYAVMTRDQLEIPAYITEYDMAVSIIVLQDNIFPSIFPRLNQLSFVLKLDKWPPLLPTGDTTDARTLSHTIANTNSTSKSNIELN